MSFALPTRGDSEPCLLDTSAALAFVQPSHGAHATTYAALVGRPKGLAGHAAFETYSVLTRLAPPDRLTPQAAQRLIEVNFPHSRFLSSKGRPHWLPSCPQAVSLVVPCTTRWWPQRLRSTG